MMSDAATRASDVTVRLSLRAPALIGPVVSGRDDARQWQVRSHSGAAQLVTETGFFSESPTA
jgi:hypothetical protein